MAGFIGETFTYTENLKKLFCAGLMKETKHTFCRICESSCSLVAELEDGRITNLRPNKTHIGTEGFACMKGLYQHKMYDSPDRLQYPLKRVGDGFERISWEQALQEIGDKVKALRQVSPQSVGMYVGTAAGFSILHPVFAEGFMQGIGSHNIYTSATQDCANRFAASTEMYGFPFHQPFVDLDHVKCMLVVGTNPVVSKWTFLQVAHPVKRLKELAARGAETIFIDPRYTESAKVGTDHIFIRPNTDVFFFLSFLHEVFVQDGIDKEKTARYMEGVEHLRNLSADWPAEKTAEITRIPAERLQALVKTYLEAGASAIVTGTGLGMGKNGTLSQWLAECINAVTGNLDRAGGTLVGQGIFDFAAFADKNDLFKRENRSRIGGFKELNGGFPGGILADEILSPGDEQIRAMFVTGGNPLMTMANAKRLKAAFEQLELLVVTDIYLNETASLAHYVLPATSPLERPDLPFVFPLFLGMQSKPYMAATEAIVAPAGEQRDEATIYTDLATACGVGQFDSRIAQGLLRLMRWCNDFRRKGKQPSLPLHLILDLLLRINKAGRLRDWLKAADGVPAEGAKPDTFLGQRLTTDNGKVKLAPAMFLQQTERLDEWFEAEREAVNRREMRLISKRAHSTHNSWTQNIDELTNGKMGQTNYLYIHPDDADRLGLTEKDNADIRSKTGAIRLPVKFLPELMPGTVAVPHGWGHQNAKGLSVAARLGGANVNILTADGPDNIEEVSGMAHLSGIPVTIKRSEAPIATDSWSGIAEHASL